MNNGANVNVQEMVRIICNAFGFGGVSLQDGYLYFSKTNQIIYQYLGQMVQMFCRHHVVRKNGNTRALCFKGGNGMRLIKKVE